MKQTEFEKWVLKNDPSHITRLREAKETKGLKVYLEWKEVVKLAEDYAEHQVKNNVSRCADQIPTNWVDPLLTGKTAALTGKVGKWGCPDIESLLRAIKQKILSIEHID